LQKIISTPTQIDLKSIDKSSIQSNEEFKTNIGEPSKTYIQIKNVLEDVNKIENESSTNIDKIKIGEVQFSKNDLSIKELILIGNEYYYKKEYDEALACYNKALEINPNILIYGTIKAMRLRKKENLKKQKNIMKPLEK
jgi:tetratricopeptide (TPR) repeat protein